MNRLAHALALLLVVAATAEAQQIAGTFDQLRVLVKPGDTLTITDAAGQRLGGKLADLSDSSLVIEVAGTRRILQGAEVDIIEKRGSDSLKNGALIGLVIGAGLAGAALGAATGEWGYAALNALVYGGMGAGIGAGLDALIEGQQVIYAAPRSTRAFTIVPILSRSKKGVLLRVGLGKK